MMHVSLNPRMLQGTIKKYIFNQTHEIIKQGWQHLWLTKHIKVKHAAKQMITKSSNISHTDGHNEFYLKDAQLFISVTKKETKSNFFLKISLLNFFLKSTYLEINGKILS